MTLLKGPGSRGMLDQSRVPDRTRRRGRLFQFAAKYWFGCSASLVGIVWLSQDVPALRPWNPLYVIFTMVVILSEKVRVGMGCPETSA